MERKTIKHSIDKEPIIIQIFNIILFFVNLAFGNLIFIVIALLNSSFGLYWSFIRKEYFFTGYNIIYLIITILIYVFYDYLK